MVILLLILALSFFIYLPSLFYSFAQDDFIHLYSSQSSNISEFLNFFNPFYQFPDIFFYRPLGTQVYFFINNSIFGLNPLPYRLESLILHTLNTLLMYILIKNLWQNKGIALLSAFFYGISSVHFLSLFYISSFQQILRTFFILSSSITFLLALEKPRSLLLVISLSLFIGALLSKETSIIFPLFLFTFIFLKKGKIYLKDIVKILPFLLVLLIYLVIRAPGFQAIFKSGYETTFSIFDILKNLQWYILWTFGLPEIISTYPSLNFIERFLKDFSTSKFILLFFLIFILTLLIKLKYLAQIPQKNLIFSVIVFFIPLLPVLIIKEHKYPQYLDLSYLGLMPVISFLILKKTKLNKAVLACCIFSFVALQYFSLELTKSTHWSTSRPIVAKNYFEKLKGSHQALDQKTNFLFIGEPSVLKELEIVLAKDYALKVWYPDRVERVIYTTNEDQYNHLPNLIKVRVNKI